MVTFGRFLAFVPWTNDAHSNSSCLEYRYILGFWRKLGFFIANICIGGIIEFTNKNKQKYGVTVK